MLKDNSRYLQWGLILVIGMIIVAGLFWVNYSFSKENPGGNDFLVHYVGTRSLIFEGLSPYSDEVAVRIQTAAYGHAAEADEHELRVAYPLYSVYLFAPFALISNYVIARAAWMTVLEISLAAMCFISIRLSKWKPALWLQGFLLFFSFTWYHALRGVINGNAVILIALGISLILILIEQDKDKLAGILLAVITIKPHLVILFIPYVLIWSIYQNRWAIIHWFVITFIGLVGTALLMLPSWIMQNIIEILRYPGYNPAGTLAAALSEWLPGMSKGLMWGIGISLAAVLIYEWWSSRRGDFVRFLWVALLTLGIGQWIGIQTDPGNFILLFPALLFILSTWDKRWKKRGPLVVSIVLGILLVGLWMLFITTIQHTYQPVQSPIMFIPLPAFVLIGLYWIKWWVISPARYLWSDGS